MLIFVYFEMLIRVHVIRY